MHGQSRLHPTPFSVSFTLLSPLQGAALPRKRQQRSSKSSRGSTRPVGVGGANTGIAIGICTVSDIRNGRWRLKPKLESKQDSQTRHDWNRIAETDSKSFSASTVTMLSPPPSPLIFCLVQTANSIRRSRLPCHSPFLGSICGEKGHTAQGFQC